MRPDPRSLRIIVFLLTALAMALESYAAENFKVENLTIRGNQAFSENRLKKLLITRASSFLHPYHFRPNIFKNDLNNLKAFYESRGYLEAAITDTSVIADSSQKAIFIAIALNEGKQTSISNVSIFGNHVFSDSLLLKKIGLNVDDPLLKDRIQQGILTMAALYGDSGYIDAIIEPNVVVNSGVHRAAVDYMIAENAQAVISEINITGLAKTRPWVVRRELRFEEGEIVRYSEILESQRYLYLTGLFESIFIRPKPVPGGEPGMKIIDVELKEQLTGEFNVSLGYGTVEKIMGGTEILTRNLAGSGRRLGVKLGANFISLGGEASYSQPWTFGAHLQTDLNLLYQYQFEPGYELRRYGARYGLSRYFTKTSNVSLSARFENARLLNVETSETPDKFDPRTRSIVLEVTRDTRNDLFNPVSGGYLSLSEEVAGTFLQGNNTFTRTIFTGKLYHALNSKTLIAGAIVTGWMDQFGASTSIPLSERFYAGGPNSVRGFGYQMVGPRDINGVPLGGRFKVVGNIELRRSIYWIFDGMLFFDFGNVWRGIRDFYPSSLRYAAGPGLRAESPIGTLGLDWGFNLDPRPGEPKTRLFFRMGQAF